MKVTLRDYMGSDKTVSDCARVSFNKIKEEFDDKDIKLIQYLAKHGHWTPFSHPQISLHVKAPIFVLRQLLKSTVGLTWNEVSRRYVDYTPEFYIPTEWRERAKDKKQGSGKALEDWRQKQITEAAVDFYKSIRIMYEELIKGEMCPEQARMFMPISMYSEGIWTGSLAAFARVYKLRIAEDTQEETREIASQIGEIIEPLFPVSWKALVNDSNSV